MKIFISYARNDEKIARKLYKDLKQEGLKPWLDREDILPGQKWEIEIHKAIKESQYVIILISPNSINKKGFIQKEIKYSLDLLDQFPESQIFIIPVRIDDCKPTDEKLQELNWADLFPSYEEGFKKILKAIGKETTHKTQTKQINIIHDFIISIKSTAPKKKKVIFPIIASFFSLIIVFFAIYIFSSFVSSTNKNFINTVGMEFIFVPPGSFFMGSPQHEQGRDTDESTHEVILSKGFFIQTTEVTQRQWTQVMGHNPSFFKKCGDNCPVEQVSWLDAKLFIKKLNEKEGTKEYRLPTEAEWEYACRANNNAAYFFGDDHSLLPEYAWLSLNTDDETHPVGLKKPNDMGLYDMLGNVFEWCEDRYSKSYENLPKENPFNEPDGHYDQRVIRGMTYFNGPLDLRCANRNYFIKSYASTASGFRVVKDSKR